MERSVSYPVNAKLGHAAAGSQPLLIAASRTNELLANTDHGELCASRHLEACEWTIALANTVGIEKMGRKICDEPPPGLRCAQDCPKPSPHLQPFSCRSGNPVRRPDAPVQRMAQHRDRARRRTLCLFYRRTAVRCSALSRSTAGTTNACSGVGWLNAIAAARRACASCDFTVFWLA